MGRDSATGLVLGGGKLQWTVLRRGRAGAAVAAQRSADIASPGDGPPPSLEDVAEADRPAVADRIRAECSGLEKPVSTVVSSRNILVKAAELPTVDDTELRNMAELQVDKFSPFAADNTIMSFETVARGEASSNVVIIAASRKVVDGVGALLSAARIMPERVDAEILCWLRLISDSGGVAGAGCEMLVLLGAETCDAVVMKDARPVLFRALGRTADLAAEDLVADVDSTLTQLESEHGITSPDRVVLWHWGDAPGDLRKALGDAFRFTVETRPLSSLPPLSEGLARRTLEYAADPGKNVNLALTEWRTGRDRARLRRSLLRATMAAGVLWIVCVAALAGAVALQHAGIRRREATLASIKEPADAAKHARRLLRIIGQFSDRRTAIECLREVVDAKPDGMEFKQFEYDRAKKKGVFIKGDASKVELVYSYQDKLNKSDMFFGLSEEEPLKSSGGRHSFDLKLALVKPVKSVSSAAGGTETGGEDGE